MKIVSFFMLLLLISSALFASSKASADTHTINLSSGTKTYYNFLTEEHYLGWGVYFETRLKATSNKKGSGASAITVSTYYNDQISSHDASNDIINRGHTYLVDSYNSKTYSYDTYCTNLYNAKTITMNKTVGWSSTRNPYINYPLKPGICAGSNYVNVNHILVNYH